MVRSAVSPTPTNAVRPAAGPARRPRSVSTAVRLMLVQAALSAASLVALLGQLGEFRAMLRRTNPAPSEHTVNAAVTVSATFYVAFLVLYVALTRHVAAGRPWARLTTWVLVAVGALAALSTLGQPEPGLRRALGLLSFPVGAAIALYLALDASNRWFRASAVPARRSGRRPPRSPR